MNENPCSNQEVHVLFEHGSELENTYKQPCIICLTSYTESVADPNDLNDHFADVLFVKTLRTVMTLWRRYDVRKITADAILFREIQFKKMDNLTF